MIPKSSSESAIAYKQMAEMSTFSEEPLPTDVQNPKQNGSSFSQRLFGHSRKNSYYFASAESQGIPLDVLKPSGKHDGYADIYEEAPDDTLAVETDIDAESLDSSSDMEKPSILKTSMRSSQSSIFSRSVSFPEDTNFAPKSRPERLTSTRRRELADLNAIDHFPPEETRVAMDGGMRDEMFGENAAKKSGPFDLEQRIFGNKRRQWFKKDTGIPMKERQWKLKRMMPINCVLFCAFMLSIVFMAFASFAGCYNIAACPNSTLVDIEKISLVNETILPPNWSPWTSWSVCTGVGYTSVRYRHCRENNGTGLYDISHHKCAGLPGSHIQYIDCADKDKGGDPKDY